MTKLNYPSRSRIGGIPAIYVTLDPTVQVHRIYNASGLHPTKPREFRHFGPLDFRFDHHLIDPQDKPYDQDRGIMYLGKGDEAFTTCLGEVFQATKLIDRQAKDPHYCVMTFKRDVQLLDLNSNFLTQIGANTAIHSGPKDLTRMWSKILYDIYKQCDGIYYSSSMNCNQPAIALFERANNATVLRPLINENLNDPNMDQMVYAAAKKLGYQVL